MYPPPAKKRRGVWSPGMLTMVVQSLAFKDDYRRREHLMRIVSEAQIMRSRSRALPVICLMVPWPLAAYRPTAVNFSGETKTKKDKTP